jgi:signal recognition particle receptor subunit beta
MALFNYATKEITIKIVYYGPGLSGKTTNLQYLHSVLDPATKGKLLSLATEADRTLFFDFLPVELGKIREFSIRFQLYTVPGQVRYNATRKLVLRGVDAIVFVADSQRDMREQNIESLQNMYENLFANNINPEEIPVILQYNKRDLPNILSVDELNGDLNKNGRYEYAESTAIDGIGVENTFQHITKLVLNGISKKHKVTVTTPEEFEKTLEEQAPYEEPADALLETAKEKAPYEEDTIGFPSPEDIFPSTVPDDVDAYEASHDEMTIQQPVYDTFQEQEEPIEPAAEEIQPQINEEIMNAFSESLRMQEQKIEKIMNNISELFNAFSKTNQEVSTLQGEIRDMKKDQKDIYIVLMEVRHSLENIKEKKSWFRLS